MNDLNELLTAELTARGAELLREVGLYRDEFFDPVKCRATACERAKQGFDVEVTICGKCIEVCPRTQRHINLCEERI